MGEIPAGRASWGYLEGRSPRRRSRTLLLYLPWCLGSLGVAWDKHHLGRSVATETVGAEFWGFHGHSCSHQYLLQPVE